MPLRAPPCLASPRRRTGEARAPTRALVQSCHRRSPTASAGFATVTFVDFTCVAVFYLISFFVGSDRPVPPAHRRTDSVVCLRARLFFLVLKQRRRSKDIVPRHRFVGLFGGVFFMPHRTGGEKRGHFQPPRRLDNNNGSSTAAAEIKSWRSRREIHFVLGVFTCVRVCVCVSVCVCVCVLPSYPAKYTSVIFLRVPG